MRLALDWCGSRSERRGRFAVVSRDDGRIGLPLMSWGHGDGLVCAGVAGARQRGFTLVEMLVALSVFALLAAAGVAVLAHAADNQGVLRERMDRIGEFQRARAVLRADLSQAAPRRTRDAAGHPAAQAFTGSAEAAPGLLFALTRRGWSNPERAPRASLQYVEYRVVEDRLERGARPALDGAGLDAPQVLLRGVRAARAHYRYQGEWLDGWPGGADRVPEALQLDLRVDGIGEVRQLFLMPGQPL